MSQTATLPTTTVRARADVIARRVIVKRIPLDRLDAHPDNPRGEHFDTDDLEVTLREVGLLDPITVIKNGDRWTTLHGHRRRLAARRIGWTEIEAVEVETPEDAALVMAVDNIARPLPPTRLAAELDRLVRAHGWTTERAGRVLGLSPDKAQLVRSILSAPPTVRHALDLPADRVGHLPLAAFQHLPRRAAPEVQEQVLRDAVGEDGRVTVDRVRRATRAARESGRAAPPQRRPAADALEGITVSPDPDAVPSAPMGPIERLNAVRTTLVEVLTQFHTLSQIDRARVEFLLDDIRTLINENPT